MRRSPRRVHGSVGATPNFTSEELGRTDGGSPSPVVEPVASHPQNEVPTLENIVNGAIKLKGDIVYDGELEF